MNEEDDFINTIAVPGGPMHFAFQYLNASGKTTAVVSYLIIKPQSGPIPRVLN